MSTRYDDIIAALQARLALIRVANGYATEAGANVYLAREYQIDLADKPYLSVFPGEITDALEGDPPPSLGEENHTLSVEIEGFIADSEDGAQAQALRQDVLKALKTDMYYGGLTEGYSGNIVSTADVEDAGDSGFLGHVQVRFSIFYVTAWGAS